jgi:hypothetical protein
VLLAAVWSRDQVRAGTAIVCRGEQRERSRVAPFCVWGLYFFLFCFFVESGNGVSKRLRTKQQQKTQKGGTTATIDPVHDHLIGVQYGPERDCNASKWFVGSVPYFVWVGPPAPVGALPAIRTREGGVTCQVTATRGASAKNDTRFVDLVSFWLFCFVWTVSSATRAVDGQPAPLPRQKCEMRGHKKGNTLKSETYNFKKNLL